MTQTLMNMAKSGVYARGFTDRPGQSTVPDDCQ